MARHPKTPEEVFEEFAGQMQSIFGKMLRSIALYGSGARGEYVPGQSDLNFLVVVEDEGLRYLDGTHAYLDKWAKRRIATPLVLTPTYISTALDTFPLEFLDMQQFHVVVHGDDPLTDLTIDRKHLRLQCERELRGKLLHLRQGFMEARGSRDAMESLIAQSIPAFTAIFRGLLTLKGVDGAASTDALLEQAGKEYQIDVGLYQTLWRVKHGQDSFATGELMALVKRFRAAVRELIRVVDAMI